MATKKELESEINGLKEEIKGLHHNFFALAEKVHKLEKKEKTEYFG
ncbi:putative nuclease with TOPRIM domain [Virgibacillus natechei]|uniref:Nuclease with TOPRIM domain n=1 Tax=Virgibacillus natechei TaxID=1216297 RepID=A0ABS4IL33_9BACI|nr:hypothetical protein [Virgibacillus natechei]MBP1971588.1 putative nuclease with TOPRIM domain [Virgibacillus natechei]UZD13079.1 hypothetical protein OLD84_00425 [Virgibacillus natechei]